MTKTARGLRHLKNRLRKEVRGRLALVSKEDVEEQTAAVTRRLLASGEYDSSRRIAIYIGVSSEVCTREVIADIFRKDKLCFVPRCDGAHMDMVKLHSMEDYRSLAKNKWDIPEPGPDEQREEALDTGGLDLIVMPGLAFDRFGNRLGQGKGFYDKYLENCESRSAAANRKMPVTVALALREQIVPAQIPHDSLDRRPDMIITPDAVIDQRSLHDETSCNSSRTRHR